MRCLVVGGGRIFLSHLPHILVHSAVDDVEIVEQNFLNRIIVRHLTRLKVYRSLDNIELDNIDCGIVLTPSGSHYEIAEKLLRNNVSCFVEKPMTLSAQHSKELTRLAKQNYLALAVGYVYRNNPIFLNLKKILDSQKYGRPINAAVHMRGNVVHKDSRVTWRSDGAGSGCLYDFGSHVIDLSLFLFGDIDEVANICGEREYTKTGVDRFKAELIRVRPHPFVVRVSADWSDESARKASLNVNIEFENATIEANPQMMAISREGEKEIISICDLDTDVNYYLRGEEFAIQWEKFLSTASKRSSARDTEDIADCRVDHLVELINEEL